MLAHGARLNSRAEWPTSFRDRSGRVEPSSAPTGTHEKRFER